MIDTVEQDWRFGTLELPAQDRYILPAIALTGEYGGDEQQGDTDWGENWENEPEDGECRRR